MVDACAYKSFLDRCSETAETCQRQSVEGQLQEEGIDARNKTVARACVSSSKNSSQIRQSSMEKGGLEYGSEVTCPFL